MLARFGGELTGLHSLASPILDKRMTAFVGGRNSEIKKVSWSDDTVWIDKAKVAGFRGVPEEAWKFHVGGYKVCEKWLKDRSGRVLTPEEVKHYQKIVVAISETLRIMGQIDESIQGDGGWPSAFERTDTTIVDYTRPERELLVAERPARAYRIDDADLEVPRASGSLGSSGVNQEDVMCLIRHVFSDGSERSRNAAIEELGRELGARNSATHMVGDLDNHLRTAVRRGILASTDGSLELLTHSIDQIERSHLKEQFLASLAGPRWTDRQDAIRQFARWFGFRRTGKTIDDVARSVVNGLLREKRLESSGDLIRRVSAR